MQQLVDQSNRYYPFDTVKWTALLAEAIPCVPTLTPLTTKCYVEILLPYAPHTTESLLTARSLPTQYTLSWYCFGPSSRIFACYNLACVATTAAVVAPPPWNKRRFSRVGPRTRGSDLVGSGQVGSSHDDPTPPDPRRVP